MNGDEAMERLLDYHRRRYWLSNGWCIRFRVKRSPLTEGRPHGIKYAFSLHDVDMICLLRFDNAHGIPRRQAYDHRHRFRQTAELVPYDFKGTDQLLCDFFDEVERACQLEGVAFEFDADEVELEEESDDDEEVSE
jgi:hypothetical protein